MITKISAATPGSKDAERWLSANPFDESYWHGVEKHPDYSPEIDRSHLHTTPGVTGYQGDDEFRQTPEDVSPEHEHEPDSSGYERPSRNTDAHEQTVCHDCAAYMANGEGDPDHEHRFERGMRDLASRGIHHYNLTFNDSDEEGNRIPPTGDQCFVCGQSVDPDTENYHTPYGAPGVRMHLFQPGERGYHDPNPGRTAGAVSRASDTVWR